MTTHAPHHAPPLAEAADAIAARIRTPGEPPEWGLFHLEGGNPTSYTSLPVSPKVWRTGSPAAILRSLRAALEQPSVLGRILRDSAPAPERVWATYLVVECPPRDTAPGETRRPPGPNAPQWRPHPYTLHTVVDPTGYGHQVSRDYYGGRYITHGPATTLDPAAPVETLAALLNLLTGGAAQEAT